MIPIYDPAVPTSPDSTFAQSQPQFLTNFGQLYQKFMVNHVPMNANGAGNHTIVELVEQPNPQQTGISDIAVYAKKVTGQTDQVFIRYAGNGQEIQYTNYQIYPVTPQSGQIPFFTFLPGGLILYFGSFTSLTNQLLYLYPLVAKNIIGMSFCPVGPAQNKPAVGISTAQDGFYQTIKVGPSVSGTSTPPCYYAVLANFI